MTAQSGDLTYIRGEAQQMANDMLVKAPAMDGPPVGPHGRAGLQGDARAYGNKQ